MRSHNFYLLVYLVLLTTLTPLPAANATVQKNNDPYSIIKSTTDAVLIEIKAAKSYFDKDPQRFYKNVDTTLGEVTDFYSFARSVMGVYASNRAMNALDAEGKKKLEQQIDRFVKKFHSGLVQTYAKALLEYGGERIEVVRPRSEDYDDDAIITQKIYGDATEPYTVDYKLRKDHDGNWKIRNVTIESINIGEIFRDQFASEAEKYQADLDKVIDNWSSAAAGATVAKKHNAKKDK